MKRVFRLSHELARRRAMEAVANADEGYVVTVAEHGRTSEQSAKFHVLLHEIGVAWGWKWAGHQVDEDDVKSILMAAFRKATGKGMRVIPGIDGALVPLSWRTRDLSKSEASDFIEFLSAYLADLQVQA